MTMHSHFGELDKHSYRLKRSMAFVVMFPRHKSPLMQKRHKLNDSLNDIKVPKKE